MKRILITVLTALLVLQGAVVSAQTPVASPVASASAEGSMYTNHGAAAVTFRVTGVESEPDHDEVLHVVSLQVEVSDLGPFKLDPYQVTLVDSRGFKNSTTFRGDVDVFRGATTLAAGTSTDAVLAFYTPQDVTPAYLLITAYYERDTVVLPLAEGGSFARGAGSTVTIADVDNDESATYELKGLEAGPDWLLAQSPAVPGGRLVVVRYAMTNTASKAREVRQDDVALVDDHGNVTYPVAYDLVRDTDALSTHTIAPGASMEFARAFIVSGDAKLTTLLVGGSSYRTGGAFDIRDETIGTPVATPSASPVAATAERTVVTDGCATPLILADSEGTLGAMTCGEPIREFSAYHASGSDIPGGYEVVVIPVTVTNTSERRLELRPQLVSSTGQVFEMAYITVNADAPVFPERSMVAVPPGMTRSSAVAYAVPKGTSLGALWMGGDGVFMALDPSFAPKTNTAMAGSGDVKLRAAISSRAEDDGRIDYTVKIGNQGDAPVRIDNVGARFYDASGLPGYASTDTDALASPLKPGEPVAFGVSYINYGSDESPAYMLITVRDDEGATWLLLMKIDDGAFDR